MCPLVFEILSPALLFFILYCLFLLFLFFSSPSFISSIASVETEVTFSPSSCAPFAFVPILCLRLQGRRRRKKLPFCVSDCVCLSSFVNIDPSSLLGCLSSFFSFSSSLSSSFSFGSFFLSSFFFIFQWMGAFLWSP